MKEIIVVAGDELAELVNKGAEADAAEDGGDGLDVSADEREQQHESKQHEQPTPEHMRDVQFTPSQLRIASGCQEEANHQHGSDAGDEKGFE